MWCMYASMHAFVLSWNKIDVTEKANFWQKKIIKLNPDEKLMRTNVFVHMCVCVHVSMNTVNTP